MIKKIVFDLGMLFYSLQIEIEKKVVKCPFKYILYQSKCYHRIIIHSKSRNINDYTGNYIRKQS